jgi:hypothetical protein
VLRLSVLAAAFALLLAAPALATQTEVIQGSPSVTAVKSGGNTVITFKGRRGKQLYSRIAGHEINLSCHPASLDPTMPGNSSDTDDFVASTHSRKLRATLEGDWCEVLVVRRHRVHPIVAVAITPAGVPFLSERAYAVKVDDLVTGASVEAASGHQYPATGDFLSHRSPGIVALASPSGVVPPGKYGFYSDAAHHIEAVGVTPGGKRLFEDVNGDTVFTNVLGYLGSLNF